MSERIVIELSEDIVDGMDDKEIEIVKLQKMMVKELTRERDSLANRLAVLVEQSSKHEIEALEYESQLDSLTARIGSLIDENHRLEDKAEDSINIAAFDELQAKHDEVTIKLDVNKKTLAQVLKTSHELERKLADAQFRLGTATQSRDEYLAELTAVKNDNVFLKDRHESNESELAAANKLIKELELDVSGFHARIDNACKAAVKQYKDTHQQSNVESKADNQQVLELKRQLKDEKAITATLTERIETTAYYLSELQIICADKDAAEEASQKMLAPLMKSLADLGTQNMKYEKYGKECSELVASIHADNVALKRDNLYLSQLMDFFGGQRIYTSPKGVTVFMLHNNFKECVEVPKCYADADTPDPAYPVFWVVHPNALGHMIMLNKSRDALLLPANLPKKYLISNGLHQEIFDAIKSVPLSKYIKALDDATEVSKKISLNAEYLDYDFAKPFERAEFIKKCIKHKCLDPEKLKDMEDNFMTLNALTSTYNIKQKAIQTRTARIMNGNKTTKKRKARKRK